MLSRKLPRSRTGIPGLALVLVGLCASARGGFAAPAGVLLDPATGNINGKVAVAVAPAKLENGKLEALSPWGFQAHLTGHDDPTIDLAFPCGVWFQPPNGRYRTWIEGEWQISPFSLVMNYAGQPFRGDGKITGIPVGEAGRVVLPAAVVEGPRLSLRLLHAGSYLEGKFLRWELSRRKPTDEVGKGLLMPVGPAIAALWDERAQRYTALSRPFEVELRKNVTVSFEPVAGVSHVVAQLQRQSLARTAEDTSMEVRLVRGQEEVPPDLQVAMADRVYAVWYGLAPGPAEVRARSGQSSLDPQKLTLSAGRIERLMGILKPPLDLQVKK